MEALVHHRKGLLLILVKPRQTFVWESIVMVIITVTCFLMEKKSLGW